MRRVLTILTLLATVPMSALTAPAPQVSAADDIEPLLGEEQLAEWRSFTEEGARLAFIEEFWATLDPTPGTEPNELREIWEDRIRRADTYYAEGPTAGHDSDRGVVLSVLGLPDEIEARAPEGGPAEVESWTYRRGAYLGEVTFVWDGNRYRLDTAVPLSSSSFVESAEDELRLALAARFGSEAQQQPSTPTLPATDPTVETTPADSLAPEVRVWMQLVLGGVARDELELSSDLSTFPAAEGTYTTLAFELAADPLSFELPLAEELTATAQEGEQIEATVGEEAASEIAESIAQDEAEELDEEIEPVARLRVFGAFLQGEPGSENTIHQFVVPVRIEQSEMVDGRSPLLSVGVTLAPGVYRLAWGVMEEGSERTVTRDETVEIPDYSGGELQITEPLLARPPHLQSTEPMSTQEVYRGVRLGDVLIRDVLDREFARDETVEVVTVVTGWDSNPNQPGRPLLEVEYRILEAEEPVSLVRIPAQSLDFHVLGQQIPLAQVNRIEAGGSYRILIRVTDLVSGEQAERIVPIRIAPTPDERSQ